MRTDPCDRALSLSLHPAPVRKCGIQAHTARSVEIRQRKTFATVLTTHHDLSPFFTHTDQICGLALSAVETFEKEIMRLYKGHRGRESDGQAIALSRPSREGGPPSWCPIDVSVQQSFHDNLAVVGPFRSKPIWSNFMYPEIELASRGPWWFGTLEHARASLISGLRHHVASDTHSYLVSKGERSVF
jgi:hypothetical protein